MRLKHSLIIKKKTTTNKLRIFKTLSLVPNIYKNQFLYININGNVKIDEK